MSSELPHTWFVTTAYSITALGIAWVVARTWLRHFLARRALKALEVSENHETKA